jgi:short-subunit dehydrogenase
LVNISSIAAIRGSGSAPAYNASKAFESIYMDGLRNKIAKLNVPITITDIQPGFVDTAMAQGEGFFLSHHPNKPPNKSTKQLGGGKSMSILQSDGG